MARGAEGDAAIRALLAAVAINGMVRSDSELLLRANAHLVETEAPKTLIHGRYGRVIEIDPMTVEDADALLKTAYANAHDVAAVTWQGQTLEVTGDSSVIAGVDNATEGQ